MKRVACLLACATAALGLQVASPAFGSPGPDLSRIHPVIFVHGFEGSAQQFESQAMRFEENGYPLDYVQTLEYDSTFSTESMTGVEAKMDSLVANVEHETGKSQVDIVGHSLGTSLMQSYLNSSPVRASKAAHYVNVDGEQASSPPGGVPTLALWAGRGTPGRSIGGATNVTIPNQTHVQTATSAESFAPMFEFFSGQAAHTTDIVPEHGKVTIAGRAVLFPQNIGVPAGSSLAIWRVKDGTGQRIGTHPVASPMLATDGSWGPVAVQSGQRYEFALRLGSQVLHIYDEPIVRTDHLIRLLTQRPGTGLDGPPFLTHSPNHVDLVMLRNKEFWGDQGSQSDIVKVNGVSVINAADSPVSHRTIAMFAFDEGSDRISHVSTPVPAFFAIPFLSAVDLFIPASAPPTGTVSVALTSRGAGPVRTVNFPNFPSSTDVVQVHFDDFEH